jgi:hypothetical protein
MIVLGLCFKGFVVVLFHEDQKSYQSIRSGFWKECAGLKGRYNIAQVEAKRRPGLYNNKKQRSVRPTYCFLPSNMSVLQTSIYFLFLTQASMPRFARIATWAVLYRPFRSAQNCLWSLFSMTNSICVFTEIYKRKSCLIFPLVIHLSLA